MDILDILTAIFPKEIFQILISYGVIYFILIFYGSEKWKNYSDFEKILFSVISGGVVWYFLVIPVSFFLTTLRVFQNELPEIKVYDLFQYTPFLFLGTFLYLLFFRFLLSTKPLRDDTTFFEFTRIFVLFIVSLLFAMNILLLGLFFPEYPEYVVYPLTSMVYLFYGFGIFYLIFLEIYGNKIRTNVIINALDVDIESLKSRITKNKTKTIKIALIFCIILILTGIFIGYSFLEPIVQLVDGKNNPILTRLEIPRIDTWNRSNLTGNFDAEQYYTVTFRLVPWVKIKSNISLIDIYGKPYRTDPNYTIRSEYEVIINHSASNTINFSLVGKQRDDKLPKIYNIMKKDLNDSVQVWDIKFTDPYEFEILIRQFSIERDKQLEYINHSINNLLTDENGKIQIDREVITFNYIIVSGNRGNSGYANQSITIFFKKNNA